MPCLPAEQFGSSAWFDRIPVPLPSGTPDPPLFVVEHQTIDPHGETVVHQQIFSQNRLATWTPERATPEPDLTLARSSECDAGDLLGRLEATEVLMQTSVIVRGSQPTCLLGIANVSRPGLKEVTAGTVDVHLTVARTPFGDAEFAIRLNPDGSQQVVRPSEADSDIALFLRWEALTEWIHTDSGLGHLINRGEIEFDGPMFKLSYITGHICWPRSPQHSQQSERFKTVLDVYAQLRHSSGYQELMDEIDEATSL